MNSSVKSVSNSNLSTTTNLYVKFHR